LTAAVSERQCRKCGATYAPRLVESAFRLDASRRKNWQGLKWTCRPCEQTARDGKKQGNRWLKKAGDVVRRHAESITRERAKRGLTPVTKEDLIQFYGWVPEQLAHDAEHQYGNGCSYCHHSYLEMGHGLADITLDIQDRDREPYYRTNTKWCCQTCNRKKGVMTPDAFEIDRQVYEVWSRQQQRGFDPLIDLRGSCGEESLFSTV